MFSLTYDSRFSETLHCISGVALGLFSPNASADDPLSGVKGCLRKACIPTQLVVDRTDTTLFFTAEKTTGLARCGNMTQQKDGQTPSV
jgi:hypothetical protein